MPVIAAPMFLVSGPEWVSRLCISGIAGTLPALNARTPAILAEWLNSIDEQLAIFRERHPKKPCAPYGVNLIVHKSNDRFQSDLDQIVKCRVPYVVASLGHPGRVLPAVHDYGGLVFADVIHAHHARKAAEAGVDGIIAIACGAGGHGGTLNPFALVREIREFWQGPLVLGGGISDGAGIRAAEVAGADLAYMGTRFIATEESLAPGPYKQMLIDSDAADLVYTDAVTGVCANFIKKSMENTRFDPRHRNGDEHIEKPEELKAAWRDIWSAGHGISTIHEILPIAELTRRLAHEYRLACQHQASDALPDLNRTAQSLFPP